MKRRCDQIENSVERSLEEDADYLDFFSKGRVLWERPELADVVDHDSIEWIRGKGHFIPAFVGEKLRSQLTYLHWKFALEVVAPAFESYQLLKNEIWRGVSPNALDWHCDFEEGHNLVFLLYFNDMKVDGALRVKAPGAEELRVLPKRGSLVMLNNWPGFYHKAEDTHDERIVADFRFKVSGPLDRFGGAADGL